MLSQSDVEQVLLVVVQACFGLLGHPYVTLVNDKGVRTCCVEVTSVNATPSGLLAGQRGDQTLKR